MMKRLVGLLKLAAAELKEVSDSGRSITKFLLHLFVQYVLLKNRCILIRDKMQQVKSYKEWKVFAKQLDDLEGLNGWKYKVECKFYDFKRVQKAIDEMKTYREAKSVRALSHMLRQDLMKNYCNISNSDLYNKTHFGTKVLIEKYHKEVFKCIKVIYDCHPGSLSLQQKLTFFAETRHSFGHTALMLSGGAGFGRFHFGLLAALFEQDLVPRTVCGSSIGSLVLGVMCARPFEKA